MAFENPGVLALVPMKPVAVAKSRLSSVDSALRQAAVLLMLQSVTRAAVEALGASGCRVIGGDALVQRVAANAGAVWRQEAGNGLNSSLWLAMQSAYREGYQATLYLPSDLPLASAKDILGVVKGSGGLTRPAGVAAARDGGTNALLVPSACTFEPLLGPDSFARHRAAAEGQKTPLVTVEAPSLAFDVDTSADLTWAREHIAGFESGLHEWRQLLAHEYAELGGLGLRETKTPMSEHEHLNGPAASAPKDKNR